MIDSFVRDLEAELGVKCTEISLAEEWKKDLPAGVKHDDVAEYLKEVRPTQPIYSGQLLTELQAGTLPYYRDSYKQLAAFRDGYRKIFGKAPFVHEALRWRW